MLTTRADALLAVECTLQLTSFGIGIDSTEEYGFVLIGCEFQCIILRS
jgi:hypothetical protein